MKDGGTESRINNRSNRINLTPEHLKELEKVFEETRFPDSETMSELSVQLHLSKRRIQVSLILYYVYYCIAFILLIILLFFVYIITTSSWVFLDISMPFCLLSDSFTRN